MNNGLEPKFVCASKPTHFLKPLSVDIFFFFTVYTNNFSIILGKEKWAMITLGGEEWENRNSVHNIVLITSTSSSRLVVVPM